MSSKLQRDIREKTVEVKRLENENENLKHELDIIDKNIQ